MSIAEAAAHVVFIATRIRAPLAPVEDSAEAAALGDFRAARIRAPSLPGHVYRSYVQSTVYCSDWWSCRLRRYVIRATQRVRMPVNHSCSCSSSSSSHDAARGGRVWILHRFFQRLLVLSPRTFRGCCLEASIVVFLARVVQITPPASLTGSLFSGPALALALALASSSSSCGLLFFQIPTYSESSSSMSLSSPSLSSAWAFGAAARAAGGGGGGVAAAAGT
eukprot:CAMPEP_0197581706 /NCGR_PEP_ID=MMETSP1326-20131121/5136_1 /TAXON_ID=1155430 /ORGANISM="Genus nov. species nov., Strain RCC2288" /LENGTH=221 /DNA_ID=CAMNT_0043145651 /DNA_START=408 /DNA_END=1073 /DNA_ORIENTATION=-